MTWPYHFPCAGLPQNSVKDYLGHCVNVDPSRTPTVMSNQMERYLGPRGLYCECIA